MMSDYEALRQCLTTIQQGYDRRDTEAIDEFMAELFHSEEKATIIGTSDNELKFDQEGIRKLFVSDWKYWGDLQLDIQNAIIRIHDDTAWVHLPGTVKYTFSSDDTTYGNFVRFVNEYFDEKSPDSKKCAHLKLAEINWLLAHLLHQREPLLKRDYYWQMRMFLVFKRFGSKWIVKHIKFSFPNDSFFADVRIGDQTEYGEAFRKEIKAYKSVSNFENIGEVERAFIMDFFTKCLRDKGVGIKETGDYFKDDSYMLSTRREIFTGKGEIAPHLRMMKTFWDEIEMNPDIGFYETHNSCLWFHTNGVFKKRILDEEFFTSAENDVKKILSSQRADKDKLFLIRRDISTAFKEYAQGEEYIYPFRFVAFLIRVGSRMYIDYIQFSYPMDNILEQINDDF